MKSNCYISSNISTCQFANYSLIVLLTGLFMSSCSKDSIQDESVIPTSSLSAFLRSEVDSLIPTVLGNLRTNPYTVANMTAAWNSLYVGTITALPATHLYVRFVPQDLEELELLRLTGEMLYDFPLEYEVLEMGDYYPQAGLGPLDIPEIYAVVEPGFQSPISGYTVLAELVIPRYDCELTAEAFRRIGNAYKRYERQTNGTYVETSIPAGCQPGSAGYPECLLGDGSDPGSGELAIPCEPGSPIWPDCWLTTTPEYGDPQPEYNACNCEKPYNERYPAGCIQVEDTELGLQGVRRVKVIMKDTWFTEDETWTDDQGCFQISKEYAGEVWTWVKFENNRCHIRGTAQGFQAGFDWKDIIKDYAGKKGAPPYNDYQITYYMWDNPGWNAHRFWGAATVNNALHEFHDYSSQDGINPPPNNLDIYVGRNTTFGFAFMPHFMGPQLTNDAIISGIGGNSLFLSPFGGLFSLYSIAAIVNQFFPDVYVGINFIRSDRLKSLAYHEIAHASHFTNVGPLYWAELVEAEVDANGHGDQNSNEAGRIAVCESWAEYLGGHVYTDRRYGSSNSTFPDWLTVLESTWNESENHIPVGLYHDLVDAGPEPLSCNQVNPAKCTFVLDSVSGFSNSQFFSCLNSTATSVGAFQNCLLTNHLGSTGNTQGQVNDLFESY